MSDEFLIPPPSNHTVDFERRVVLYTPDGNALVRQAGFRGVQTTTTNPPLHDNTKRRPPRGGKGGKRG